jgi:hypothetical protein
MLLAPATKQGLADLGKLVGVEKVELVDGQIERMDQLLLENPPLFDAYALRDPEVCVKYSMRIADLNAEITGKWEIPPTLSSIGVKHLLGIWEASGIDHHAVLGTEVVTERSWSERRKQSYRVNSTVPIPERHLYESFTTECYHGGKNETYFFGAGESGLWTDWDLAGAYTTAMAVIGMPDWKAIRQTRDLDDFQPHAMAFARVKFRFPENTRFPSLPVRSAFGLIFPLEGESFCGAPEVYLALRMGAQVDIVNGVVLPASFDVRPFETFIVECTQRRKSHAKGSLDELLWKEIGNSTYGKTAQGLRRKRAFDSRTGQHRDMPPSRITNPYFAAYTTSLVRAVLGEILSLLPLHANVCSATTDGFLTNATDAEVMAATEGPLCRLFAQARIRICGDPTVVERKHRIAQPLGWRTRGQATLESIEGEKPVLAKAGLKPPMKDKAQHNEWIVDTFVNRTADSKLTIAPLRGLADIWKNGGDLVPKEIVRRINMDYDWKRRPVGAETRPINGADHVYFDTVPWRTVAEFLQCREQWERFHGNDGAVLKTLEDVRQFEEYRSVNNHITGLKRPKKDAALKWSIRMFLRAYTRSVWGLDAKSMSYRELALWLTENGYPTTKEDVENARRPSAKLYEHVADATPAVDRFIEVVKAKFPTFDSSLLVHAPKEAQSIPNPP